MLKNFISQIKSPSFIIVAVVLAAAFVFAVNNLQNDNDKGQGAIKTAVAGSGDETTKANDEGFNIQNALSERSIGQDDAPVVIHEYSSLSCGHCAKFHNETLAQLKENYVDPGKVKIVFHDFPLNKPALYGTMISRCIPKDQYYNFTQLLFENQEKWAFSPDFESRLSQYAKLAGLSSQEIENCFSNEDLQKGITDKIQAAQQKWGIQSTPTFVFDDGKEIIAGAQPYSVFKDKIDQALKDSE